MYDGRQEGNEPLKVLDTIHRNPVVIMRYNPIYDCVISFDNSGMVEYWTGYKTDFQHPKNVKFSSKLDTHLFDFVKDKVKFHTACVSPNGKLFAVFTSNRKVCTYKYLRLYIVVFIFIDVITPCVFRFIYLIS